MKYTAYLFTALAVLASGVLVSCEKEKTEESPVINKNAVEVEGISLDKTVLNFTAKEQTALVTATITPEDASDKRILWKSSDEKVAKVSNGVVESVGYGTATITATTYAGGFVASCSVIFPDTVVDDRAVDLFGSKYPIYWSSVNFGAKTPEGFGSFVSWGEVDPKSSYSWASYLVPLSSWCGTDKDELKDVEDISGDAAYDPVTAKWGDGWRMPTVAEVDDLIYNAEWTWTSSEGVYGYKVSYSASGKSIFLPVGGYYDAETHAHEGAKGRYWVGDAGEEAYNAYSLDFTSDSYTIDQHSRYLGFAIRPVQDK